MILGHAGDPGLYCPPPGQDRERRTDRDRQELVLRQEQQEIEPWLLAAADIVLAQPVQERAVSRNRRRKDPVPVGKQRREESDKAKQEERATDHHSAIVGGDRPERGAGRSLVRVIE